MSNNLEIRLTLKPILDGLDTFVAGIRTQLEALAKVTANLRGEQQSQAKETKEAAVEATSAMQDTTTATEGTDAASARLIETLERLNAHLDTIARSNAPEKQDEQANALDKTDTAARKATGGLRGFLQAIRERLNDVDQFNKKISNGDVALRKWASGIAAFASYSAFRRYAAEADDADRVTTQLNRTLERTGQLKAAAALHDQAKALAEVTLFEEKAIRETQRLLISFGLTAEQARQMTESVLDFAQETGQSAESAAMFVGRALAGEHESLSRYGLQLDKTKGKVDAVAKALQGLASGAARGSVSNPEQRQVQVRHQRAAEAMGQSFNRIFYPIANTLIPILEKTGKHLEQLSEKTKPLAPEIGGIVEKVLLLAAAWAGVVGAKKLVMAVLNPLRSGYKLLAGEGIAAMTSLKLAFGSLGAIAGTVLAAIGTAFAGWQIGKIISELEAGGAKIGSYSAAIAGNVMAFGIEVWGSLRTLWNSAVATVHSSSLSIVSGITGIITTLRMKANEVFHAIATAYNNTVAKLPGVDKIDLSAIEQEYRNLFNKRAEGEADTAAKIKKIREKNAEENLRIEKETEQRARELRTGGREVLAADRGKNRNPDTDKNASAGKDRPDLNAQNFGNTAAKTAAARELYILETEILQAELAGDQLRANALRRYIQEQEDLAKLGDDALDLIWDRVEAEEALDAKTRARQTAENTLQNALFKIDQDVARVEADKFTNEIEKNDKIVTLLEQKDAALRDYKALLQGDLDSGNLDPQTTLDTRTKITGIDQEITKNEGEKATRTATDPNDFTQQLAAKATEAEDALGTAAQRAAEAWGSTADSIRTSLGSAFTDMLWQGESLKDAMTGFATSIAQSFIGNLAQMAADWIYQHTIMAAWKTLTESKMTLATLFGAKARSAAVVTEETTATAAKATGTTARTGFSLMDAGKSIISAAAGAMSAVASVPYVGPILAVAAVAAILALGAKVLGAFATGGLVRGAGTGTSDDILARLSDGEYVMPAATVDHYGVGMMDAIRSGALDLSAGVESIPAPLTRSAGGAPAPGNAIAQPSVPEINLSIAAAIVNSKAEAMPWLESRDAMVRMILDTYTEHRAQLGQPT